MSESTVQALVILLSAVFEALPKKVQRRASILIEDSTDLVDDPDAKRFLATFRAAALPIK
jgi:hypothetical protein